MPTPNIAESLEEAITGAHAPAPTPVSENPLIDTASTLLSNGHLEIIDQDVAELRLTGAVTPAQQRLSRPMEAINIPHRKVSKICCIGAGYVGMCVLFVARVYRLEGIPLVK